MSPFRKILYTAAGVFSILIIGTVAAPKVAAAARAALVEIVVPSSPVTVYIQLHDQGANTYPFTAPTGISSVTINNYDSVAHQIQFYQAFQQGFYVSGGPRDGYQVAAHSSVHLVFPTPLVFQPNLGGGYIGAELDNTVTSNSGYVEVYFNGFSN